MRWEDADPIVKNAYRALAGLELEYEDNFDVQEKTLIELLVAFVKHGFDKYDKHPIQTLQYITDTAFERLEEERQSRKR